MKKLVICLFAALCVMTLTIGAAAAVANNGGIVGGVENIVGGAVRGAEDIAGGVVNGAENIIGGTHHEGYGANNAQGVARDKEGHIIENNRIDETAHRADNRNPRTSVSFGLLEFAAIGTTMLGTAALAGRRRK